MSKRLLPYGSDSWVRHQSESLLAKIQSPHQNHRDRLSQVSYVLERTWEEGQQSADGHAFRWGLVIGAASGGFALGILQWLAGRFL